MTTPRRSSGRPRRSRNCAAACAAASVKKVCTRNQIDAAVAIADVCKTLIERERSAGKVILPPVKNPTGTPHTEKIAVIGAGPPD